MFSKASAVKNGKPKTTPKAIRTKDLICLIFGIGCLKKYKQRMANTAAITARAPVRNSGLKPETASRVAGMEPAKIMTPNSPCIHPRLRCFMP